MRNTSSEKSAINVFGELVNDISFSRSLRKLFELSKENWQTLFEKYISAPYRRYYCHHSDQLASILKIEDSAAHRLFHIFDLLAYSIAPENDLDEIINAFRYFDFNDKDIESAKTIVVKLQAPETRKRLRVLDLIDDEIGSVNQHLPRINYHIDQRIVFDEVKPIDKIDVILFKFEASHDKNKKMVFELTEHDIDHFIKSFELIKSKLENLKRSSFSDGQKA